MRLPLPSQRTNAFRRVSDPPQSWAVEPITTGFSPSRYSVPARCAKCYFTRACVDYLQKKTDSIEWNLSSFYVVPFTELRTSFTPALLDFDWLAGLRESNSSSLAELPYSVEHGISF